MSDTPQSNESINETVNEEVAINDSAPVSDTGNPVQDESNEQVDEVAVAQEKANAAFNKQYGEKKQLERDLAAQREINSKHEQAERDRQTAAVGDIPDMPDSFDDDYDAKLLVRDEAIRAQANHAAMNNAYVQQQQLTQQQAVQAQQVKVQESVVSYTAKATELGINKEELSTIGSTVANYGLSDELVMHILADSDGPLIAKHLAANAQDGYELANMSPYAVGSFLNNIKEKAIALKPKTSKTPAPVDSLQGTTSDFESKQYKYLEGSSIDVGTAW